jgi:hypothetical protein
MASWKMWCGRYPNSQDGFITVQDNTGFKVFDRLPFKSGQNGYLDSQWVRGKSPIPLGNFWLITKSPLQPGQFPVGSEIGEFYRICSNIMNPRLITDGVNERWDVGLHPDNDIPSSIGCPALQWRNDQEKAELVKLHYFLEGIEDKAIEFVSFLLNEPA